MKVAVTPTSEKLRIFKEMYEKKDLGYAGCQTVLFAHEGINAGTALHFELSKVEDFYVTRDGEYLYNRSNGMKMMLRINSVKFMPRCVLFDGVIA